MKTSSGQVKVTAARLTTVDKPPLHQVKQFSPFRGKQQLQVGQVMKKNFQKEVRLRPAPSKSHEVVSPYGESPTIGGGSNNLRRKPSSNLSCGIRCNPRISRDINGGSSDRVKKKKRPRGKKKLTDEQIVDLLEISSSEDENDGEALSNTKVENCKKRTKASLVSSKRKTSPEVEIIIFSDSESSTSPGIETINLSDSDISSGEELSGSKPQQTSLSLVHSVPPIPTFRKIELKALREKKKSSKNSKFDLNMNELDTNLIEARRDVTENLSALAFTDQWNPWKDFLLKQFNQPEESAKVPKPSEGKEGAFDNDGVSPVQVCAPAPAAAPCAPAKATVANAASSFESAFANFVGAAQPAGGATDSDMLPVETGPNNNRNIISAAAAAARVDTKDNNMAKPVIKKKRVANVREAGNDCAICGKVFDRLNSKGEAKSNGAIKAEIQVS